MAQRKAQGLKMAKRNSHVGKSIKDKEQYIKEFIKAFLGEEGTFKRKEDTSATDSPASDESQEERKEKTPRPRPRLREIQDTIKDYSIQILIGLVVVLITSVFYMAFALNGINKDIGILEERTKSIPKIQETLTNIDKNFYELRKDIEYKFKAYDQKIEESDKTKKNKK